MWIVIMGWLTWWLGGTWLTVRVITKRRDFFTLEIFPALFTCAILGPFIAAIWMCTDRAKILFPKR